MPVRTQTGFQKHGLGVLLMLAVAAIIAGCATATMEEPTGGSGSAGSESGGLEQIVVTGARQSSRSRTRETAADTNARLPAPDADRAQRQAGYLAVASAAARPGTAPGHFDTVFAARADEELWIIARPDVQENASTVDDTPGSGAMLAHMTGDDGAVQEVPLPLKHTAVNASIDGYISTVDVRQQFGNPYGIKIEAVYLFPLPEKAAVSEFVMTIGERRIRGILREKEEAVAIYAEARRQGYNASLLVQHRPNVFEQKVANIEPGKAIDVEIRYFHTLAYHDGWYSFVFPTVVGPRFNPPGTVDPIAAVPRGTEASSTAVSYLRPGERSGHDIDVAVTIDAGVEIRELRSTHRIVTRQPERELAEVSLDGGSTIPNRDFIVEFRVAGRDPGSNLLTWQDPGSGQGYFTMMLYPPATLEHLPRQPMEFVFVIDASGSMSGVPIRQAKDAVASALSELQPGDTFQIIRFSDAASRLGAAPLSVTPANIARANAHLAGIHGSGGTMMVEGIKAALDFDQDPSRLRFVVFMTDGYIGNEADILAAIHERIGNARIFSFGVGSSVNRYLLERMAKVGRGAVAYLGPQDSGGEIMSAFLHRVSHPALVDLAIDWGRMGASDVYPSTIPDLFVGRHVVVTGKFTGVPGPVTISGLAGGETQQLVISPRTQRAGNPALAKVWARLHIADLVDRMSVEPHATEALQAAIRQAALEYGLMSDYTAFVAVDASKTTPGTEGVTVRQPVPVPDGVRYETTVTQP